MARRKSKPAGFDIEVISVDPRSADFAAECVAELLKSLGYPVKGPIPQPARHGRVPPGQRAVGGSGFARLHTRVIQVRKFIDPEDTKRLNDIVAPQGPDIIVRYWRPDTAHA